MASCLHPGQQSRRENHLQGGFSFLLHLVWRWRNHWGYYCRSHLGSRTNARSDMHSNACVGHSRALRISAFWREGSSASPRSDDTDWSSGQWSVCIDHNGRLRRSRQSRAAEGQPEGEGDGCGHHRRDRIAGSGVGSVCDGSRLTACQLGRGHIHHDGLFVRCRALFGYSQRQRSERSYKFVQEQRNRYKERIHWDAHRTSCAVSIRADRMNHGFLFWSLCA